jgi:thiol-disulfide isomerase/thioredoxin
MGRTADRRTARLVAAATLTMASVVVAGCSGGGSSQPNAEDLAALSFTRFDGTPAGFADYEGQPLVVNFFASWCEPCKTELPDLQSVHEDVGDRVAFLGIDTKDTVEDGRAMADAAGLTYDLARDPSGSVVTALGGVGMPTTVLVSADGDVVASHTGALEASELRAMIDDKLLG